MAKGTRQIGMLLLGIWLVLEGITTLISFPLPGAPVILGVLALVAGVLLLVGR